jgi:hypothetical protein
VTRSAPRIGPKLRAAIAAADDGSPAAEVCRRAGDAAELLGVPRPSYEQVRVLLAEQRQRKLRPTGTEVLVDIATRMRPATDFDAWLADTPLPYRRGAKNEPLEEFPK